MYAATGPPLFKLNLDILQLILRNLDTYSLAALGQTCRLFYTLVRRELNFESAVWQQLRPIADPCSRSIMGLETGSDGSYFVSKDDEQVTMAETPVMPPVYHSRCMARVGNRLLMPFMTLEPVCFTYDITLGSWLSEAHPIHTYPNYAPFVTPVVSIGTRLYMFGGRQVLSSTLSNDLHVLDTQTWTLEKVTNARGPVPRPRFDHSLDVLEDRYLVIFGGLCPHSPGENDLFLFDTKTNTWFEPRTKGQIPTVRFGHASALAGHDFFIFGGSQIQPEGNMVYDVLHRLDCRTWTWYKYDHPEAYSYRRRIMSMDGSSSSSSDDGGQSSIETSLRRDLILETTGNPPRDRFRCDMQLVGPHKLVIFGGQTIRQDGDDNNVLHAYSLQSIDVFDFPRKYWSVVHTTALHGENNTYPQDVTSFVLEDPQDGYNILVIGQQKVFSTATESSSGETISDLPSGSSRRIHHYQQRLSDVSQDTLSTGSSSSAAVLHQQSPSGISRSRPAGTTQSTLLAPLTESPGGDLEMTSIVTPPSSHWRRSRPFMDYENFLDSSMMSSDETSPRRRQSVSHHSTSSTSGDSVMTSNVHPLSSPTYDSLPSFLSTGPSGSGSSTEFNIRNDLHRSRQYNVEPLSILLALNR